jgi:hypothetical protein
MGERIMQCSNAIIAPAIAVMSLVVSLVAPAARAAVVNPFAFTGPVTSVSGNDPGHVQFPTSEAAVSIRPHSAAEKTLDINNYWIHDLVNQKGLEIKATRFDSDATPAWAYQSITIRNSRFTNIERREDLPGGNGLHIDHIRIGGGVKQDVKTNILIENVVIDGGDALPILITDGVYGTVTLRNVVIKNTSLNNVQLKTDKVGSIDKIIIDGCPGLGVALIGRPGSIGEVLVRNSDGIRLGDSLNATGRSGATISFIDASHSLPGASAPEPTTLPLLAGALTLLTRRRR